MKGIAYISVFFSLRPLRVSSRAKKNKKKENQKQEEKQGAAGEGARISGEEKRYVMGPAWRIRNVGGVVALLAGLLPFISIFCMHCWLPLFGFNCCMRGATTCFN